ncbi:MAG: T9SS type A sorting domain-containing protein [Bacteroidales bacterium]|nr:T9SS type A sorting domain-containing protein [Bacteroidales bacterium]
MKRYLFLFIIFASVLIAMGQEKIIIDSEFRGFVAAGTISKGNVLNMYEVLPKNSDEKPFSIEVTYTGSKCHSELSHINIWNSRFPLMWYAIGENGERSDPIINPDPSQLQDHTTYLIMDFHFHTDTVYVDFAKSFEFHGVHPNPVSGNARLNYSAHLTIPANYTFYDIYGKEVKRGQTVFDPQFNELFVDTEHFTPGTYFLNIDCECVNQTIKLIHSGF